MVDAMEAAGGSTQDARLSCINLARIVNDEDHLHIPGKDEVCQAVPISSTVEEDARIDLNRATLEELITLPGIGPVLAKAIIDYREENGSFQTTDEIMLVSRVGAKTYEAIRDLVDIGGASP